MPAKYAATRRKWREANHDKWVASKERWRKANMDKMRLYQRRYLERLRLAELGITRAQKLAIYEDSDGLCAICYEAPATDLDHDHQTMQVRGALCNPCNQGLGFFKDNPERLGYAADYINSYREVAILPKVG